MPTTSLDLDERVLETAKMLIGQDVYPSSRALIPFFGASKTSVERVLRRLRKQGRFPTRLPRKPVPNQKRSAETSRHVACAYNDVLDDGRMPTPRRVSQLAGVSYTTTNRHLKMLHDAGQLAEVPNHVREAEGALINRVKDWTLYKTILKVYSVDCEKNKHHARMSYRLIADMVSQILGRPVSSDRVGRCLNAIGYRRLSRRSKVGQF